MRRAKRERNVPDFRECHLEYVVIEFTRDIEFPRGAVARGERYAFVLTRATQYMLQAICLGGSFELAGGECDAGDVELVHVGRGDIDWRWLSGHV